MSYVLKRKKLSIPKGTFKPNYTVVGSPTVNNGVVSGFSASNYLKLPNVFNPSSAPWEVVFKVNVTDYSNGGIILGQRNGTYFYIRTEATGVFVTGYSNTILNGTTQIALGKDYWVKARHDGTKLYLELSEDGINYTEENSVTIPPAFSTSSDPQYVGLWYNTYASGLYNTFNGSIDLKESYIKIGSDIWWNCKYNEDVYDTISYVAKRKIRWYYKYKCEDYTLPVMTSNTAPEGTVTTNIPTSTYTTNPYSVFWNKSATWNYWHRNATGERYLQYDFATPLVPDVYRLSLSTHRQSNVTTSTHNWYLIYEDGTKELILNYGKVPTSSKKYSKEITASKPVKAVRYELNAQASADGSAVEYISYLNLASKSTDYTSIRKITGKVEVSPEEYTPVTEGFSESFSGISSDFPVVTQVGSSDLYKVYWEHLKGTSGTYTEPAYTSYIKKTEFDALANESLLTQYNEDGSLFANPKPMYKVNQYLTSGESYRIGSPDYFFVDEVKSYVAKRKIRRYYKYKYEDWEQPNFTGYTTGGAVVSATSEDTGDGRFAWKALQTSTQPAANTSDNYGKNNTSTAVWKVKFPYLLKISKIEHQARNWNNSIDYNTVGAYYADEAKTKKIGDVNSPSSGAWTSFNIDYLTDTILLDMTGGGSWSGIGRLKITAQKATPVEVSASDDYDYYVDTLL